MTAFFAKIADLFLSPAGKPATPARSFSDCLRDFRALLTANNTALELMAELEETAAADRPFGVAFLRGHCTALTVNVYKMITNLQAIADGKYGNLHPAFMAITKNIEAILARQPAVPHGDFILPLARVDKHSADLVGEKMANLGEIRNKVGLPVPAGFVITAAATHHFMAASNLRDEINRRLKTLPPEDLEELYKTSAAIQQLIINSPLPEEIAGQITAHYKTLAGALVAMRSSAIGEDHGNVSFAGQYRTQLNVSEEFLAQTYKEIVASKFRSQAIVYRMQRGFRHQDVVMCVGCLAMVDAVVSGVTYSRSPADCRSSWLEINAAAGLASQVVNGTAPTVYYRVERQEPHAVLAHEEEFLETAAAHERAEVLSDGQCAELARVAVRLETHFGTPQDIEWSIDRNGRIVILQSRPLARQAEEKSPAPAGGRRREGEMISGGTTASRGAAAGPVHLVRSSVDLLRFPPGAVLVTPHPLPEWATVLPRAAAVVSDTGQAAAHLATVAREFGIPAIFGLRGATASLRDGQMITVDATACRVHEGRREEILQQAATTRPNLMLDSPVYKLLREVMQLVTPLHLTNPASPYFKASSCRSLHDLTRFCHEKAVVEMFSFGEKHGMIDKSAKQLIGETPYTWWVINLEDGFRPTFSPREKFISIDDIVSVPMLAIWEGMTAVPWAGPPPLSLKGFGSILFHSTMNPDIDPAVRSTMNTRNYFLVSKNFCNLNVRLGYHFALVEANLGEYLLENYVSFQFKGGAADETRRRSRVRLLTEILSAFGFRIEQKVDAMSARMEKKPAPYLVGRLKILGYLLIHTRQIDMVMGDEDMVARYREKIMADLSGLLRKPEKEGEHG
ncbi:PEP/pyruvate-binding domain-containing protein [Thiovibrio sp. JS02]